MSLLFLSTLTRELQLYVPKFPLRDFLSLIFWVDFERSVPAAFSMLLLLLGSILVAQVALARRARGGALWRWWLLGALFLYAGFDEYLGLHERASRYVAGVVDATGLLYYPWVLPGTSAALVVAILMARLVLEFPRPIRRLAVCSGVLYLGGALGVEMLGAAANERYGADSVWYDSVWYLFFTSVEEAMEMFGAVLWNHAMLRYLSEFLGGAAIVIPAVSGMGTDRDDQCR
ncbi:MAG: hypothetical protein L0H73_08275 [Nitrococcus sp.]|nr:hypothetical protein [Nitrococcus sp.]